MEVAMTDREMIVHLAAIRRARHIKQSTVARRMGTHASAISVLENHSHPSLDTAIRYANAIGARITIETGDTE
jgi:transcriptional regulator with XRE-family HTH domain